MEPWAQFHIFSNSWHYKVWEEEMYIRFPTSGIWIKSSWMNLIESIVQLRAWMRKWWNLVKSLYTTVAKKAETGVGVYSFRNRQFTDETNLRTGVAGKEWKKVIKCKIMYNLKYLIAFSNCDDIWPYAVTAIQSSGYVMSFRTDIIG